MISLEGIHFAYAHKPPLFVGFSWQVERAAAWSVIGPSGCGKTTLLYLLAGLLRPAAGEVRVDDSVLTRPRPQTGLILQDYGLLPWNTVLENVRLGLDIRRFYGSDGTHAVGRVEDRAAANQVSLDLIERTGLSGLEKQYPARLSGGQRQRVAIARTLALAPDLLLMDEPFSSLDAGTRESLRALVLSQWRERHLTFVVVTHAIEEALFLGQKILVLGTPPHTAPVIFDNPCFGLSNPADHPAAAALTKNLRDLLLPHTGGTPA